MYAETERIVIDKWGEPSEDKRQLQLSLAGGARHKSRRGRATGPVTKSLDKARPCHPTFISLCLTCHTLRDNTSVVQIQDNTIIARSRTRAPRTARPPLIKCKTSATHRFTGTQSHGTQIYNTQPSPHQMQDNTMMARRRTRACSCTNFDSSSCTTRSKIPCNSCFTMKALASGACSYNIWIT